MSLRETVAEFLCGTPDTSAQYWREHIERHPRFNERTVIRIPLNQQPQPSASGKTLVVASTHGNQITTAMVNGKPVVLGLNAYIKH